MVGSEYCISKGPCVLLGHLGKEILYPREIRYETQNCSYSLILLTFWANFRTRYQHITSLTLCQVKAVPPLPKQGSIVLAILAGTLVMSILEIVVSEIFSPI